MRLSLAQEIELLKGRMVEVLTEDPFDNPIPLGPPAIIVDVTMGHDSTGFPGWFLILLHGTGHVHERSQMLSMWEIKRLLEGTPVWHRAAVVPTCVRLME